MATPGMTPHDDTARCVLCGLLVDGGYLRPNGEFMCCDCLAFVDVLAATYGRYDCDACVDCGC